MVDFPRDAVSASAMVRGSLPIRLLLLAAALSSALAIYTVLAANPSQVVEPFNGCDWNRRTQRTSSSPALEAMGISNVVYGCPASNASYLYVCFRASNAQWYCYNRGWTGGVNYYAFGYWSSDTYGEHQVAVGFLTSPLKTTYAY